MQNLNVMVDLETCGTTPGSAILTIGAVIFDPWEAILGDTFYYEISFQSNVDAGLEFQAGSADWWLDTNPTEFHRMEQENSADLTQTLQQFNLWTRQQACEHKKPIECIWANSPSFDLELMKAAMLRCNIDWPFDYWQERDVRTAKYLAIPMRNVRIQNDHHALRDAINQANFVSACCAYISNPETFVKPITQSTSRWR